MKDMDARGNKMSLFHSNAQEYTGDDGSEMSAQVRALDWTQTLLGPITTWSPSLKTTVQLVLDNGFPMSVLWGPQLIQIYNDGYRDLIGDKHPAALGQATQECWPEEWHINQPIYDRVWRGETITLEDMPYPITRHGHREDAHFTLCYSPVRDENAGVAGVLITAIETTARVRAAQQTQAQLTYKAKLIDGANDAVVGFDTRWRVTYWNSAAEQLYGWTHNEALGKAATDVFGAYESAEKLAERTTKLHRRRDGTPVWVDVTVQPLYDDNGQCTGYISVIRDAALIEAALHETEIKYRTLFESIDAGFCVIEVLFDSDNTPNDYRFLEINPAFEQQTGIVDAVGKRMREIAPGHEQYWFDLYGRIALTGEALRVKQYAAELQRFYDVYAFRLGQPSERKVAVIFTDSTSQYETAAALQESEERYRTLFENTDQGFCIFEMLYDDTGQPSDYRFLAVNPTFERHTGLHNALGKTALELVPNLEKEWIQTYGRVAETGEPLRFEQGSAAMERWFEVEAVRVGGERSRKVALIFTEVSERKRVERDNRFLAEVSEHIRVSEDADAMLAEIARMTGEHLHVTRCYFVEVQEAANRWVVHSDYGPPPSMVGTYPLSTYSADLLALHRKGQVISINDTAHDPLTAGADKIGFAPFGIRAIAIVPLLRDGHWVAELVVSFATAHDWRPHDISLLETVAERTWNAVEKLRLAAAQRLYFARLQQLNAASLQINAATTYDDILPLIADEARMLFSANKSVVTLVLDGSWAQAQTVVSIDKSTAVSIAHESARDAAIARLVYDEQRTLRLTDLEHAAYHHSLNTTQSLGNLLAVALIAGDGRSIGVLQLVDSSTGEFTDADEALLQQLCQIAVVALENQALYTQEQAARAQAEEASRLKDDFLATVSHELRTPLTSFLGYAQLLQRRKYDEGYVGRTVEKMVQSAKVQAQLIEDLLDVSRIVSGKLRLDPQPIDLGTVIHAALDTVNPAVEAKELQLHIDLSPEASTIVGDANRLQQVVWNLLSNAVKFTPSGGDIWIQLQRHGRDAQLTVRDTGQGISPAFLPYVFDRFRQADSTSNRAYGGLGLGLAIVRHLVELHGGTVMVESAGTDEGSTFTVRLPLDSSDEAMRDNTMPNFAEAPFDYLPELHGLRILIVDDQQDLLELLEDILVPCGAVVRLCTSARAALALVESWRPDLLLSDIAMPDEDGYWLISMLRELPADRGGAIPAIALTAYVRMEDRLRVLAAGFQHYVPKPVDAIELRTVIARLVQTGAAE